MADLFNTKTLAVLTKVLDGTAARQRVLADNIANVETPGYQRKDIAFEDQLRETMSQSTFDSDANLNAIEQVAIRQLDDTQSPRRADGNNVNIESEMVNVAKNSLQYEATVQMLSKKFSGLHKAIFEGKK